MGAGKTTVGKSLADRLRWTFIDLDDVIISLTSKSVPEIFRDEGEPSFRQHETAALRHVLEQEVTKGPTVIALGGGAFVQSQNLSLLRGSAHPTIFLDAAPEELRNRCAREGDTRPLFRDENQFRQLYEARRSGYMEADLRVETGGKSIDTIVNEVISRLDLHT
jgi:shikimate kinase